MENDIHLTLENYGRALERIRLEEIDRYKKHIKISDRDKISLVSSIMMDKIIRRLEANLTEAVQNGKPKNLSRSLENILLGNNDTKPSKSVEYNDFTHSSEKRCPEMKPGNC